MATQHEIEQKLTALEESLDKDIKRSNSMQMTTMIVGVILILIIGGYFAWAGYWTREMMQPKELAGMASTSIVTFIRDYRPTAEREAQANAGPLVNRLVDEVLENQLPSGRRFLESYAQEETARALDRMTEYLMVELEASLVANQQLITDMSENLETSEGREEFRQGIVEVIEESISDPEIERQIDEYAFALKDLEGTLTRITTGGENLSASEKATYDLVAVVLELADRNLTGMDVMEAPSFEGLEDAASELP